MARRESTREDLIRDAVALVNRIELISAEGLPIVVGFRKNGAVSCYFGEEPVYQFNAVGGLRRAHLGGIIKVESGRLIRLDRHRVPGEVHLVRHEFGEQQQREFLDTAALHLHQLRQEIETGRCQVSRLVSAAEVDVLQKVRDWLRALPDPLVVADDL